MATSSMLKKVLVGLRDIDKRFLKNIIVYLYFKVGAAGENRTLTPEGTRF